MTRAEHYLAGKAEGERWAEADLRDGRPLTFSEDARKDAEDPRLESVRAHYLGIARGYRLTVARFEAGELTREMFELAPEVSPMRVRVEYTTEVSDDYRRGEE